MFIFFFNDTATTEIYTLSLHDALPIYEEPTAERRCADVLMLVRILRVHRAGGRRHLRRVSGRDDRRDGLRHAGALGQQHRSEEHMSELQSRQYLVCRLLLEKKKKSHTT